MSKSSAKADKLSKQDIAMLLRALELAHKGVGLASPNPCVGAVIVGANGEVVGEGTHLYADRKHAEIVALEQIAQAERMTPGSARGATLYLSLEPCSHFGRTPPCTEAIIAAGIRRVVCLMQDPNPQVAGQGFAMLRASGIEVALVDPANVSLQDALQDAHHLNEAFAAWIRRRTPLVTLKAGMTLDGRIAAPPSHTVAPAPLAAAEAESGWITGTKSRAHVHELRHASDAILVGVGTVLADNPLLNDRSGLPRRRPLLRVVMDSKLRLPLMSRLVKTAQEDVIVFCSFAEEKRRAQLENSGIRVEQVPLAGDGLPDLNAVLHRLGAMEITSLLIEGGSRVNAAALTFGIVDKVFLYYAPILLGGEAVPVAGGAGFRSIAEAARLRAYKLHRLGDDFAVEGYLKDPYTD